VLSNDDPAPGDGGAGRLLTDAGSAVDYRSVFDAFPNPCAILSPTLRVVDVNAAYPALIRRSRRELIGQDLIDVLPMGDGAWTSGTAQRIRDSLARALRSGRSEVLPVQRVELPLDDAPDSPTAIRYWLCTATPILGPSGTVVSLLHKIQDVTPVVLSIAAELSVPNGGQHPPVDLEHHADLFALARDLQNANALLLQAQERERETSLTLQRAMLPAVIPENGADRTAARYLPAATSLSVGGDWYDVAALPDGRLAVAVGDVVGKGLAAAAVMGQLRSALSAVTVADVGPGNALEVLDRFARLIPAATATTAVKVVFDFDRCLATYSSAGHLPPLLQHRNGTVEPLDKAIGPPLATTIDPQPRPQATVSFEHGANLILYTDGLVERRTEDLTDSLNRLTKCLRAHTGLSPDALADSIIEGLLTASLSTDDTILLVIRL
jgi:serine phosphatase RsbU (regulator of sigma subunit)